MWCSRCRPKCVVSCRRLERFLIYCCLTGVFSGNSFTCLAIELSCKVRSQTSLTGVTVQQRTWASLSKALCKIDIKCRPFIDCLLNSRCNVYRSPSSDELRVVLFPGLRGKKFIITSTWKTISLKTARKISYVIREPQSCRLLSFSWLAYLIPLGPLLHRGLWVC